MLYCTKCRSVSPEGARACVACRSQKLRPARDGDFVYLQRANEYTAGELCSLFRENGIRYESRPYGKGRVISLYDMEVMPTDKALYVVYGSLEAARVLVRQREEQLQEPEEEENDDVGVNVRGIVTACAGTLAFIAFIALLTWLVTLVA